MGTHEKGGYYLAPPSHWPIFGSIALFCMLFGAAHWLHDVEYGPYLFMIGVGIMIFMMFGWFGQVIREDQTGLLANKQMDRSFRWGMCWFIFSEVVFFGAFFGALFYIRVLSVPWLGGEGSGALTHLLLWPNFESTWPLLHTPNPEKFVGPQSVLETWGLPALNTLILLTSGATITVAHWAILKGHKIPALLGQGATILLGILFLVMQVHEYSIAYLEKGLTLDSGVFGTTFFMLTGFHGLHVTIGTIMLIVIFFRIYKEHFTPESHFAFEAVSWYWHFVDVVWLILFVFVYWI